LAANFGFREELTGSLIGFGTASLDVKARQDVAELEYAEHRNAARSTCEVTGGTIEQRLSYLAVACLRKSIGNCSLGRASAGQAAN
jgi:hypothetical protein